MDSSRRAKTGLAGDARGVVCRGGSGEECGKIWIDLDNSPHVPFFVPIIEELENRGYSVVLTARDCFQVRELADLFHLKYRLIGHHYGKHRIAKLFGLFVRTLQLWPAIWREKPALAVSHGSRSQLILSKVLGFPSMMIGDYEFAKVSAGIRADWMIVPDVVPVGSVGASGRRVLSYPGIKEDVYAASFTPQAGLLQQLGIEGDDVVVTIRPPATEAHYHVPESEELFEAVIQYVGYAPGVKVVLLPRNARQADAIRAAHPRLFAEKKAIIPEHAVDGLNLVWHSDLVISGGGTMNREAAALGVPVYSIFRGRIGAVDRYLEGAGRLTLIERREEIATKLKLVHRLKTPRQAGGSSAALERIVELIVAALAENTPREKVVAKAENLQKLGASK